MSDQGFNISQIGYWPKEKYAFYLDNTQIPFTLGNMSFFNSVNHINNPAITIDKLSEYLEFYNINVNSGAKELDYISSSSNIVFLASSTRLNDYGPYVKFFTLNTGVNPLTNESDKFAYLFFPQKLFLKPISAAKISNTSYNITLSAVLVKENALYFNDPIPEKASIAPRALRNYISNSPTFEFLPTHNSGQCTLFYDISSTQTIIKRRLINFTRTTNPATFTINLENNSYHKKLRRDFTFVESILDFEAFDSDDKRYIETLTYLYYDNPLGLLPLNRAFNFHYDPAVDRNIQSFSYVNSGVAYFGGQLLPIQDSRNSVLSATINLATSNFRYNAKTKLIGTTNVNVVSGKDGTPLTVSYIADCSNLLYTGDTVNSTINNFYIHGSPTVNLGRGVYSTSNGNDTITINTKYPPHYYSYNVSITSSALPNFTDSHNSSFNLSSISLNRTNTSVFVKTYLYADFNCFNLDLKDFAHSDDSIIYNPSEYTDPSLISAIQAFYYINSTKYSYDLSNPTWLKANVGHTLEITYPTTFSGKPVLTLRPKLSTLAGVKDAVIASQIELSGLYVSPQYPLNVNRIKEDQDYIDITSETMVSENIYPGINLIGSNIKWNIYPENSDVKLLYLSKNSNNEYTPINTLQKNTLLDFNSSTWAVRVSGYGPTKTAVTFYSEKYNSFQTLSTNERLFDSFAEGKIIVGPVGSLNNLEETRTITLTAGVPYKGRLYNLPINNVFYWNWSYDNVVSLTSPVTGKYINNTVYTLGDNNKAISLSSLKFEIKPPLTETPSTHNIIFDIYSSDTADVYKGSYQITVDNFPSRSIFNADFDIAYQSFPNEKILETRKNQFVLTRAKNSNALYRFTANTDIIPNLTYQSLIWEVTTNGTTTTYNGNTFDLNATANNRYDIVFKVLGAAKSGWPYLHNIYQSATVYSLPQTMFDKEVKFNIYPEYTWKNSDKLTLLNNTNYTLASSPTAYGYKRSNTQTYYVSANADFVTYKYAYGTSKTRLGSFDTITNKIEIPYNTQYTSNTGVVIYLTGYNNFYPENTPLFYKSLEGGFLVTRTYNIVSQTIPYNTSTPANSLFFQNPKLVDYNGFTHSFSATITALDLDFNRNIVVRQKFTENPLNTPAKILTNTSTVTYILSSPKWTVTKDIPATDGTFSVFNLKVGDDLTGLTVNGTKLNTLSLNATANLNIQIPPATFDNYDLQTYQSERNLWNSNYINLTSNINSPWKTLVAYSTSTSPEIFLSTNYSITGNPVFVEFKTPDFKNNPIVSYAVNFGGDEDVIKIATDTFYHTYSSFGTFYIRYSAIYLDGSKKSYIEKDPFIIKPKWIEYNQEAIRFISESKLELPYTLDEILIQPNEYGDADIFNTSVERIGECLDYLKNNIQTMNIDSPSYFYGWLGVNYENKSDGIRWYMSSYGEEYYNQPTYSNLYYTGLILENDTTSYITSKENIFYDIKDIHIGKNYIYVLDNLRFRLFKHNKTADEIIFSNREELDGLLFGPKSMTVSDDENSLYIADSVRHKIYRFDFDFSDINNPIFTLVVTVGTFGSLNDSNKFDFPSEIFYSNDYLYVLDYNNNCIKQYSKDLSWVHTYYDDILENDQILNMAVHQTGLLYIITKNSKVHVFDEYGEKVLTTLNIQEIGSSVVVKISFDENGEFLYIVTKSNVLKYTANGQFITTFNLPNIAGLEFTSCKYSTNRCLNISTKNAILRFQDFVDIFKIGEGLGNSYWENDQIFLKKSEFAQDLNYNVALNRLVQNLKTFRNSINSKFVLVSEQTGRGTVTYFSLVPISLQERVIFDDEIEDEKLYVGVNEFHTPSVLNREFKKLYDSILLLKTSLDVSSASVNINGGGDQTGCLGEFCWSWKSMSCYNLSLPVIRLCNINPITYAELVKTFPVNYAPSKSWQQATSNCCNEYVSPLD